MKLIKVERIAPLARAVRDAAQLPPALVDALYGHLGDYVGQSFDGTRPHTERLAITLEPRRFALTVVFFVDTDGTLNVESIAATASSTGPPQG